jgi:uncharacterized membrane protein
MAFCPSCGTQIADGATCPKCAGAVPAASAPAANAAGTGLAENVASALAYFTFIPAVAFLVLEPYNKNRVIRFHAFQCLFLTGVLVALGIVLAIVAMIPIIGLVTIPLHFLIWIGAVILWVILVLKAYQNQKFKLPVIGDMAEKQAEAM